MCSWALAVAVAAMTIEGLSFQVASAGDAPHCRIDRAGHLDRAGRIDAGRVDAGRVDRARSN